MEDSKHLLERLRPGLRAPRFQVLAALDMLVHAACGIDEARDKDSLRPHRCAITITIKKSTAYSLNPYSLRSTKIHQPSSCDYD